MDWRRFVTYLSNDPRTFSVYHRVDYMVKSDRCSYL